MTRPGDPTPEQRTRAAVDVSAALLMGVGCYLGQLLATALRMPPAKVAPIWMPIGLFVAALVLVPARRWPVYLGVGYAAMVVGFWPDAPPAVVLLFVAAVLPPFVGAAFVTKRVAGGRLSFDDFAATIKFVILVTIASVLSGLGGAAVSVWGGLRAEFWVPWSRMTLTVLLGTLVIAPIVLGLVQALGSPPGLPAWRRAAEGAALGLLTLAVALVVFGGAWFDPAQLRIWTLYCPLPLLLWAAVRFGPAWTSAASFLLIVVSTWNAAHGRGPYARADVPDTVLSLQLTLLSMVVPTLVLSALIRERRRTTAALAASEQEARGQFAQLATVYRTAPVGLAFVGPDVRFRGVNDQLAEMTGRPAEDHVGRELHEVLPKAFAAELEGVYRRVLDAGEPVLDTEVRAPDGGRVWLASHFPVRDDAGELLGVNTVVREITEQKRAEDELRRSLEKIQDLAGRLIAAQETERSRIGRELHDNINQQLAALSIRLSGLKRAGGDDPGRVVAELGQLQQAVASMIGDVRRLSHEFHPGTLRHAGLVPALEARCAEFRDGHAIDVTFAPAGATADIPADVALCLYRVAQEALQNISRYADARHVRIDLSRTAGGVELRIADDGRGFDPSARTGQDGLGLLSMDERVRLVKGTLRIDSRPARGTVLEVAIPLE